jgi:hypothetical protein
VRKRFGWYEWVTIALGAAIVALGVAQAIADHTWQPIWTVGWIPAVLVASLGTRWRRGRCWPRSRRRLDP